VLQKHKIRASPTLNSDICDYHPEIVRAAVELGWEILGHNETNSRWLTAMEPDEERESIARALAKIADSQPSGPTARERQVLGFHKKHKSTSPLYEEIRAKYPDW